MRTAAIISALGIALLSCGGSGSSKVFDGADAVIISSPLRCTKVWYGSGDVPDADNFMFGLSDKLAGIPEKRVMAAVFYENPPRVGASRSVIQNPQDAVWVWHTGMDSNARPDTDGTGTDKDGLPVSLRSCEIDKNCQNLRSGRMILGSSKPYFFSIWAWNNDREISYYSDTYVPFCWTDKKEDGGRPCDQMDQSYCAAK
jgi:hypothetical protein